LKLEGRRLGDAIAQHRHFLYIDFGGFEEAQNTTSPYTPLAAGNRGIGQLDAGEP
jgi:hypothetical protein